jgi:hypothetical protein
LSKGLIFLSPGKWGADFAPQGNGRFRTEICRRTGLDLAFPKIFIEIRMVALSKFFADQPEGRRREEKGRKNRLLARRLLVSGHSAVSRQQDHLMRKNIATSAKLFAEGVI